MKRTFMLVVLLFIQIVIGYNVFKEQFQPTKKTNEFLIMPVMEKTKSFKQFKSTNIYADSTYDVSSIRKINKISATEKK